MARGFKSGGRQKGSRNKRTVDVGALTAKVEASLAEPFGGDAHALLMLVYKDQAREIELRLDAAKAAIKFEKPSLASTQLSGDGDNPLNMHHVIEQRIVDPDNRGPEGV